MEEESLEDKFKEALGSRIPSIRGESPARMITLLGLSSERISGGEEVTRGPYVRLDWYGFPVEEDTHEGTFRRWTREFYEESGYSVNSHVTELEKEGRKSYVMIDYMPPGFFTPNHLLVSIGDKGG